MAVAPSETRPDAPASSSGSRLRLGVVIVNFRTPGLVLDCLASLEGQVEPGRDIVVVVDNGSGDGSDAAIESGILDRGWVGWARVVRAGRNGGFSAGNNAGIREADAAFYLLLNSDTLVRRGAVEELLRAADQLPDAGLIGPRLEFPDGRAQCSAFRRMTPLSQFERTAAVGVTTRVLARHVVALPIRDEPHRADWLSFACVLVRRACLEAVGPMDEGSFMYFEDIDFASRARRAGFEVWHWPRARVVHLRGGTSEVKHNAAARKRLPAYYYAARARYLRREFGWWGLILGNLLWHLGCAVHGAASLFPARRYGLASRAWRDIWITRCVTPAGVRGVRVDPEVEPLFEERPRAGRDGSAGRSGHG